MHENLGPQGDEYPYYNAYHPGMNPMPHHRDEWMVESPAYDDDPWTNGRPAWEVHEVSAPKRRVLNTRRRLPMPVQRRPKLPGPPKPPLPPTAREFFRAAEVDTRAPMPSAPSEDTRHFFAPAWTQQPRVAIHHNSTLSPHRRTYDDRGSYRQDASIVPIYHHSDGSLLVTKPPADNALEQPSDDHESSQADGRDERDSEHDERGDDAPSPTSSPVDVSAPTVVGSPLGADVSIKDILAQIRV